MSKQGGGGLEGGVYQRRNKPGCQNLNLPCFLYRCSKDESQLKYGEGHLKQGNGATGLNALWPNKVRRAFQNQTYLSFSINVVVFGQWQ